MYCQVIFDNLVLVNVKGNWTFYDIWLILAGYQGTQEDDRKSCFEVFILLF